MLLDTWKFPWPLIQVKAFLNNVSLNVTGYMEISVDPLGKSIFFNNVSLNVTGYMEISMDAF